MVDRTCSEQENVAKLGNNEKFINAHFYSLFTSHMFYIFYFRVIYIDFDSD